MNHENDHDASCIEQTLAMAEEICAKRGVRLTPLRRRVLKQIWQSHEAIKAYDLIRKLSSADHTVKPPTIYRTLDFLLQQGLIHRIESSNGFVGCDRPQEHHHTQLFVCRECGLVREWGDEAIPHALDREAARQGFRTEERIVEVRGLCAHCQERVPPA